MPLPIRSPLSSPMALKTNVGRTKKAVPKWIVEGFQIYMFSGDLLIYLGVYIICVSKLGRCPISTTRKRSRPVYSRHWTLWEGVCRQSRGIPWINETPQFESRSPEKNQQKNTAQSWLTAQSCTEDHRSQKGFLNFQEIKAAFKQVDEKTGCCGIIDPHEAFGNEARGKNGDGLGRSGRGGRMGA